MAYPTIRDTATGQTQIAQTIEHTLPTVSSGDIILVTPYCSDNVVLSVQEVGYSEIDQATFQGIDGAVAGFWKLSNGTETTVNVDIAGGSDKTIVVQSSSIIGCDQSDPISGTPSILEDQNGTSFDPPSVTTDSDENLVFSIVGAIGSGLSTPSQPSGYTSLHSTKLSNHYLGTAYVQVASASTEEDPGVWSSFTVSASCGGVTFAFQPPQTSGAAPLLQAGSSGGF